MFSLLFALALGAQDVPFSPSDARAVAAVVLDDLAPAGGVIGGRSLAGRPLLIDQTEMEKVFQRVMHSSATAPLTFTREVRVTDRDHAVRCGASRGECEVLNDGLFVRITDAAFSPATDEMRVHCVLAWSRSVTDRRHYVDGYDVDIVLKRDGHVWKVVSREHFITG